MHGRLPTCNWAKIIKRSQDPSWEGKLRVRNIFKDRSTSREYATVVWNNDDIVAYTATWLELKCPQTVLYFASPDALVTDWR